MDIPLIAHATQGHYTAIASPITVVGSRSSMRGLQVGVVAAPQPAFLIVVRA
jgi:hypothetical protein